MNMQEDICILRDIGTAFTEARDTVSLLGGILKVIRERIGMTDGAFVMQHNAFWSAENMLGFDFKGYSGAFGKYKLDFVFESFVGKIISAEILTEEQMNARYDSFTVDCVTDGGVSHIRLPLHYRQHFIGFFEFNRPEGLNGIDSRRVADMLEIVGRIVADVSETRTNQLNEKLRLLAQNRRLKTRLEPPPAALVGESDSMRAVYTEIRQVAPTEATVLIRGGSGTGKELIARSIVENSRRKDAPFIALNCAALPETLIESELFGHEKGAFTGAVDRRIGRAEEADGGTLFLDEIGDLTVATQVKLLRFLQERTFSRLGSNKELRSDVRFIAATSRNLEELMEKKLFREDLYYRLNIFLIQVPSLSERGGDIIALSNHFIRKFNAKYDKSVKHLSPKVTEVLIDAKWPGNVRELENCIERAVLTSTDETIRLHNLPPKMQPEGALEDFELPAATTVDGKSKTLAEMVAAYERSVIDAAIERCHGNASAAGRSLGLSPRMMYYKLGRLPRTDQSPASLV